MMISDRLRIMKAPALRDADLEPSVLEFIALWASTVDWTKYEEAIVLVDLNVIYFFSSEDASHGPTTYDCAVRTAQGWCLLKDRRKAIHRAHELAKIMASQPEVVDISERWYIQLPSMFCSEDEEGAVEGEDDRTDKEETGSNGG